jgi:lipoprotein-anchoring transpeptidase ErfK/SrfK
MSLASTIMQKFIFVLLALMLLVSGCAKSKSIPDLKSQSLADMLSPDELAEEMKVDKRTRAKQAPSLDARLQIFIDKAERGTSSTAQKMLIYLDRRLIAKWSVSTGREHMETSVSGRRYRSSTPKGIFRIYKRVKNYFSNTWQAPMPFAQFLIGGVAIHATTAAHYRELGTRASGGCVRLHSENAAKLWKLVAEVGITDVIVTIYDGEYQATPDFTG